MGKHTLKSCSVNTGRFLKFVWSFFTLRLKGLSEFHINIASSDIAFDHINIASSYIAFESKKAESCKKKFFLLEVKMTHENVNKM